MAKRAQKEVSIPATSVDGEDMDIIDVLMHTPSPSVRVRRPDGVDVLVNPKKLLRRLTAEEKRQLAALDQAAHHARIQYADFLLGHEVVTAAQGTKRAGAAHAIGNALNRMRTQQPQRHAAKPHDTKPPARAIRVRTPEGE